MTYDSRPDTYKHILQVQEYMKRAISHLAHCMIYHDDSKLHDPELALFDEVTPRFKELEYGTPEYEEARASMGPALQHHYEYNSHHPEFYTDGIKGMSLMDLLEMVCDWKAAGERHADGGDIFKSIEINQKRFGYSNELKQVLINTAWDLHMTNVLSTTDSQHARSVKGARQEAERVKENADG